ncbi:MAG: hypothetical protein WA960_21735 [Tunicatimonas sp.]
MKQSLVIFALLFSASFAHGQSVGLGIGSGGIVFKSNPNNDWRFAGRFDLQLASGFGLIQPSLMVARQVVNEDKAKFYVGGEIGARIITEFESTQVLFRIPLGVEYFPFENVPISATVEGSPYFLFEEENTVFLLSSLLEITYYFGQ